MDECKRSGQIPAFGNWDQVNELPITQYFQSARQAGLIRHSSFSDDLYIQSGEEDDVAGVGVKKLPPRACGVSSRKPELLALQTRNNSPHVKEQKKKVGKVSEVKCQPIYQKQQKNEVTKTYGAILTPHQRLTTVKPVDEDLYKIPSEVLSTSKRKKMLGFFSRCLVPPCQV